MGLHLVQYPPLFRLLVQLHHIAILKALRAVELHDLLPVHPLRGTLPIVIAAHKQIARRCRHTVPLLLRYTDCVGDHLLRYKRGNRVVNQDNIRFLQHRFQIPHALDDRILKGFPSPRHPLHLGKTSLPNNFLYTANMAFHTYDLNPIYFRMALKPLQRMRYDRFSLYFYKLFWPARSHPGPNAPRQDNCHVHPPSPSL